MIELETSLFGDGYLTIKRFFITGFGFYREVSHSRGKAIIRSLTVDFKIFRPLSTRHCSTVALLVSFYFVPQCLIFLYEYFDDQ